MTQKRGNEHKKAQKLAKEQDEYTCFFCNKTFKSNHGHHLIQYVHGGDPSVNNMITLCSECHRDYHSGKIKADIIRF